MEINADFHSILCSSFSKGQRGLNVIVSAAVTIAFLVRVEFYSTALTQYDLNYTALVVALQKWGQELYNQGRFEDACAVLEFAVKTRTDISGTYRLLIDMYKTKLGLVESEISHKLQALTPIANELNSLSRNQITKMIDEALETMNVEA